MHILSKYNKCLTSISHQALLSVRANPMELNPNLQKYRHNFMVSGSKTLLEKIQESFVPKSPITQLYDEFSTTGTLLISGACKRPPYPPPICYPKEGGLHECEDKSVCWRPKKRPPVNSDPIPCPNPCPVPVPKPKPTARFSSQSRIPVMISFDGRRNRKAKVWGMGADVDGDGRKVKSRIPVLKTARMDITN